MNKITLIGNSGADAELKTGATGSTYCFISVATSEKQKDGTFETTWHAVKMFGRIAEQQAPLIKKGSKVFVEGRMQYSKFKETVKAEVIAFQVGVFQKMDTGDRELPPTHAPAREETFSEMDIPF